MSRTDYPTPRYHDLIDAYGVIPPAERHYAEQRERWERAQAERMTEAERDLRIEELAESYRENVADIAEVQTEILQLWRAVSNLNLAVEALAGMVRRAGGAA